MNFVALISLSLYAFYVGMRISYIRSELNSYTPAFDLAALQGKLLGNSGVRVYNIEIDEDDLD